MQIFIDDDRMNVEYFGGIELYRPRISTEDKVRKKTEPHIRSLYPTGKYTNKNDINAILQHKFKFYSDRLSKLFPSIASLHLLEFLLFQYDQATTINELYKQKKLTSTENQRWSSLGPKFRRCIKYLAERIILLQPNEVPRSPSNSLLSLLDEVWICAEEMVELYNLSDQTYAIFPDDTILEILPEGELNYFDLSVNRNDIFPNKNTNVFQERVSRDTINKSATIGPEFVQFLHDVSYQDNFLRDAFNKTLGVSYIDAIQILYEIIDGCQPSPEGFPIPLCQKDTIIDITAQKRNISKKVVESVIEGFLLTKENMSQEDREIWKPKQEYRAFYRGFFELSYQGKKHIMFSKWMAKECLINLIQRTPFQNISPEWDHQLVRKSLDALSNETGKWFEKVVEANLNKLSISGIRSIKSKIGQGNSVIRIPSNVGEIDFLGYSEIEKLLVLIECKMVKSGSEGQYFRDDISKFVTDKKSYLVKFRQKVDWVRSNFDAVCKALDSRQISNSSVSPTHIATALVTYRPSIVEFFIDEFPCVSITNLILDYQEKGKWPYSKGVFPRS